MSQLVQFFGSARYTPADERLRQFVPPTSGLAVETRAAAAWALGKIHEGKPVPALAKLFASRVAAVIPIDVEVNRVRRMCATAIGYMKAEAGVPTLRQFYGGRASNDEVGNACGWAIERITGEKMAPPDAIKQNQVNWFLTTTEGGP
jgi:hypothetical protein